MNYGVLEKMLIDPEKVAVDEENVLIESENLPIQNAIDRLNATKSIKKKFSNLIIAGIRQNEVWNTTAFQFTTNEPQSYVLDGKSHPLHITSCLSIFMSSPSTTLLYCTKHVTCVPCFIVSY